ncbi:MAG: 16S rRNA (cytosine(1402)-N(4))-methyltransferase RsmH [Pseudomonadota bacterium]|nr:16S rRNA (cytosine(1402)-N(4))-methyltransferase RsmH [Pseudomonadota bacterium]
MSAKEGHHVPVLLDPLLEHLSLKTDGIYIDGTFGRGGHSKALIERLGAEGRLFVIDRDEQAIFFAKKLAQQDSRIVVVQGSFGSIAEIAAAEGIAGKVNGLFLDLGVSSPQLDDPERGFSFQFDGPLDMRMDRSSGMSAADWLDTVAESELRAVIKNYGEDIAAKKIARVICEARDLKSIRTTKQLAELIEKVISRKNNGKHPATKTFQAIRIQVNDELTELKKFLDSALGVLAPFGRLSVISFHSLEDRLVKRYMRNLSRIDPQLAEIPLVPDLAQPRLNLLTKAIRPSIQEVKKNRRARSAVLRVAEKLR